MCLAAGAGSGALMKRMKAMKRMKMMQVMQDVSRRGVSGTKPWRQRRGGGGRRAPSLGVGAHAKAWAKAPVPQRGGVWANHVRRRLRSQIPA